MSKLCLTFDSLYKSTQAFMLFRNYLPSSQWVLWCLWSCGQISEDIFFFLNPLMQKNFFDKSCWFQLLSTKYNWISVTFRSLSLGHSIISSFCYQKNNLWLSMKKKLLTKSPNARKFCFSACSLTFFCFFRFRFLVYWDPYCKFARFNSLKPLKNVLTKSP